MHAIFSSRRPLSEDLRPAAGLVHGVAIAMVFWILVGILAVVVL